MKLVAPPVQEIVVHNNCTLYGSGLYYGHFLVLKLIAGRLRVIFDALERGVESPYDAQSREQTSTFDLRPGSKDTVASIGETAHYVFGDTAYTVKRSFLWDEGLRTFVEEVIGEVRSGPETRTQK